MRTLLALLLLSCAAVAQTTPPAAKPAPAPASKAPAPKAPAKPETAPAAVPPSAPVITINGLCEHPGTAPAAECKTVVTRAEFDKLANSLNPEMPPATRIQLANAYWRMLVMAREADKLGIATRPETQEVLRFTRLQTLSQILVRDLQQKALNVPAAEVEKYYNEHKAQYEEASLQRIFIPKTPQEGKPVDAAKLKAEADKIRAAAAAGGDVKQLQQQAYTDLELKGSPPPVDLNNVRRETLPPNQAKIFDLAAGQVSEPLDESGGFYVYKMVSKRALSMPDVEQEIKRNLGQTRMQQEMEAITKDIKPDLNQAYFGAGEGPEAGGPPAPGPRSAAPAPPKLQPPVVKPQQKPPKS